MITKEHFYLVKTQMLMMMSEIKTQFTSLSLWRLTAVETFSWTSSSDNSILIFFNSSVKLLLVWIVEKHWGFSWFEGLFLLGKQLICCTEEELTWCLLQFIRIQLNVELTLFRLSTVCSQKFSDFFFYSLSNYFDWIWKALSKTWNRSSEYCFIYTQIKSILEKSYSSQAFKF